MTLTAPPRPRPTSAPRPTRGAPHSTRPPGPPRPPRTFAPTVGTPRSRQGVLTALFLGLLAVFLYRLVDIQVIHADALAADALDSRLVTSTIDVQRANIVDRDGAVLATSIDRYHVWVNQQAIADWKRTENGVIVAQGPGDAAEILAPILGMDEAVLEASLTGDKRFHYVLKDVSVDTFDLVRAERIAGIDGEPTSERLYPNGDVAGNIVGFMGGREDRQGVWGIAGLEYTFEDYLIGTPGQSTYEMGGGNLVIPTGVREHTDAVPGSTLVTTINRDLQWYTQEVLDAQVKDTGAEWGSVVVLDVATGEVLALADSNSVDPREPGASASSDRGSRSVEAVFEPGSTGKVITMAAVIEEGLATPTSRFTAPYEYTTANNQTIKDSHWHYPMKLTLSGILVQSSNTGTVIAGEGLDRQTRHDYLSAFGFGERTGVGLPGESPGILRDADDWDGRTLHNVLFGQGVSVTAMQSAVVYQTIANGGVRLQPTVVAGFEQPDGTFVARERDEPVRVVSEETAAQVMLMLESVVEDGTGTPAAVKGYRVAGKTGTAQAADANGELNDLVTSFVGIAPADDPRIVVAVTLYNPSGNVYGSSTAGPVFADVTAAALRELDVAPSGERDRLYPVDW